MSRRPRRLGAAALFAGAASAVLAAAGPDALMPFEGLATAAAAEATVSVAFIVDFGTSGHVVACVKVPSGTNGYQALAAFTSQEQEQAPTYNASGLLCSINGDPASGCGQAVDGGYVYWSYWLGTSGTWQYASTGAFADVQTGDVEGWRFEDPGKANPSDPPPAATPNYTSHLWSIGTHCASECSDRHDHTGWAGARPLWWHVRHFLDPGTGGTRRAGVERAHDDERVVDHHARTGGPHRPDDLDHRSGSEPARPVAPGDG